MMRQIFAQFKIKAVECTGDTLQPTRQKYDACVAQLPAEQAACWAQLDLYLTTRIVPWVPYEAENHVQVVPSTVAAYSFDQGIGLPALDRVSMRPRVS